MLEKCENRHLKLPEKCENLMKKLDFIGYYKVDETFLIFSFLFKLRNLVFLFAEFDNG